ncbi:TPA: Rrf2 family transcriptional regulator [Streptococcus suis]|uniref:RrF2 family transcriptional regulator n=1 Tax=Streptococcus suis TaxID=1307 RepID=UPI00209B3E30|nr:Rrf2 family transcriptional regulator [Streptococcus suis]MCO8200704.1 Rrf2 family transcriptional regulator [Streptococcus suis]MCO8218243.1 Rrf2 family transcriptional regulator [Streptococcus suis]HEM3467791.1 Rrf2 family transcriptional regulator [Streptococcus suis]HEM3474201.1 Rrf2 family transcriptional regulator [Streptococcus suis]HEM3478502.1 Rrf2 family transcriptional regulator [Streptococcus suis]
MKINKSVEQAVYVLIILALQEDHRPVKSHVLSQVLQVSDSYLKKILMKLSKAGLVSANASKAGGYQLGRSIEEISLKDVFYALQLHEDTIQFKHLSHSIFDDQAHVEESENKILTTLENGLAAFYAQLDQLTLSQLLHQEAYENGAIDWEGRIKD